MRLNEIVDRCVVIEAINIHPTIKNFKPPIGNKGTVKDTPFLQTLELKKGAKVQLTYNIDTLDCLTNGTRGEVRDFLFDDNGNVKSVMIKFQQSFEGQKKRDSQPLLCKSFPGCTAIEKIIFQYSLAKKSKNVGNTAKVVQFRLSLCFAATSHRFQGQTIYKPNKVACEFETIFQAAQGYVMLSRVQCLDQLLIIDSLPVDKLYASQKALDEVKRMEHVSLNVNPSPWFCKDEQGIKIASLNCRSLIKHFLDVKSDPMMMQANVICLTETWLCEADYGRRFDIDGYGLHLNSFGFGKGLGVFFKDRDCSTKILVKENKLQISKLSQSQFDVIAVYRSKEGSQEQLIDTVQNNTSQTKPTIVMGDFNLCAIEDQNCVISQGMLKLGFSQLVTNATHIGGILIIFFPSI